MGPNHFQTSDCYKTGQTIKKKTGQTTGQTILEQAGQTIQTISKGVKPFLKESYH